MIKIQYPRGVLLMVVALGLLPASTFGQLGGSRGGVAPGTAAPRGIGDSQPLVPEVALGYITIQGQAELRVTPTEIRIVLAVTAEGDSPAECKRSVTQQTASLVAAWVEMGIPPGRIVEDFIAVLPRYEFGVEEVGGRKAAVEKRTGYIMQSNLHVAVKDDTEAMAAVHIAFAQGVADIIGFDYWSKGLDATKVEARAQALKAAKDKANTLLTVFEKRPPIINVQESTRVVYPESLYESFTNSADASYVTSYARGSLPEIRTFRPKNTYYRGLYLDADVQSKELPMRSEISVVSTVRLYYESPATRTPTTRTPPTKGSR